MAYNRDNAVAYAKRYWDTVCHDKAVATATEINNKKISKIVYPAQKTGIDHEDDCTHFVSCCIGSQGGGLLLGTWEMPPAYGVLSPLSLIGRLQQKGFATPTNVRVAGKDAVAAVNSLDRGDVIAYYTNGDPTAKKPPGYFHAALYLGGGLIACHTSPRFGRPFTSVSFASLTVLHITV
jgi:hypothetical protein